MSSLSVSLSLHELLERAFMKAIWHFPTITYGFKFTTTWDSWEFLYIHRGQWEYVPLWVVILCS